MLFVGRSTAANDRTKNKSSAICDENFCCILDEEIKDSSDETPVESPLCDESSSQR